VFAHNVKFKSTANLVKIFLSFYIVGDFLLALNPLCVRVLWEPRAAKGEHAVHVNGCCIMSWPPGGKVGEIAYLCQDL
jgi:hypothetical protein